MPTGYTAAVQDGTITEFTPFAMQCARAFGALITMRDEPSDALIPESFPPSDWHEKSLAKAKMRWNELKAMAPAQCEASAFSSYNEQCEGRAARLVERAEVKERYEAMLEKAKNWTPPTGDHDAFQKFMVQQLEDSIESDCSDPWANDPLTQMSGTEWLAGELIQAEKDIAYYTNGHAKELQRTVERNAWVKALRESLAIPSAS
jgi:hypothetical protein